MAEEERRIRYDINALKRNLKKCDDNIILFQEAIAKEYANKAELQHLIEIEEKERKKE